MRPYSPDEMQRAQRESSPNEYDEMRNSGMSKEERASVFYRPHTFLVNGPGRKETRNYISSVQRLLPMPPKSTPITKELVSKMFRGEPGRVRREKREANAIIRSAQNRAKRKAEHKQYLDYIHKHGQVTKNVWREIQAKKGDCGE